MSRKPVDFKRTYDAVAEVYARTFYDELERKPFDRELLDRFADSVRGMGTVADVGCGPGHVGRYLADRGVEVLGIDLSPEMVRVARRLNPFPVEEGDMQALPYPDARFAGLVCFYAVIHLARDRVDPALRELHRVATPAAPLLIAVHGGEGDVYQEEFLGVTVPVQGLLFDPAALAAALGEAGFAVDSVRERPPYDFEYPSRRVYVLARA